MKLNSTYYRVYLNIWKANYGKLNRYIGFIEMTKIRENHPVDNVYVSLSEELNRETDQSA